MGQILSGLELLDRGLFGEQSDDAWEGFGATRRRRGRRRRRRALGIVDDIASESETGGVSEGVSVGR